MATTRQIDNAFRLAGYDFGRPTIDNIPDTIYPYNLDRIVTFFNEDVVNGMLGKVGESPSNRAASTNLGFPYLMAAEILSAISASDVTTDGRNISLTSITQGGLTSTFESSAIYKQNLKNRIQQLRAEGRRLSTTPIVEQVIVNPPAATGGLDFDSLSNAIVAGEHIDLDVDNTNQTITVNAPYDIRAVDGFGDAVYESLKLIVKSGGATIADFSDSREELKFNVELDKQTLQAPLMTVLQAGTNVTLTPDNVNDTITISASGGAASAPTKEQVYDQTKEILIGGAGLLVTDNDSSQTQTIGLNGATFQTELIKVAKQEARPLPTDRGKLLAVNVTDETKLDLITPPTAAGSRYTPPNELNIDWAFTDGTDAAIDYLRRDAINRLFGDLTVNQAVKRKDIRMGFHGYLNGFTSISQLRSLIVAGITVRTNSALTPGEYIRDGKYNLYGEFTNSNLETILTNQTSGSTRVALSYNIDGLFSLNKDIPWLTNAQATANPLTPYIPAEAIIGGTGGGLRLLSSGIGGTQINRRKGTDWTTFLESEHYDSTMNYFIRVVHRTSEEVCHDFTMLRPNNIFPSNTDQTIMACSKKFYVRINNNTLQMRVKDTLENNEIINIWVYGL